MACVTVSQVPGSPVAALLQVGGRNLVLLGVYSTGQYDDVFGGYRRSCRLASMVSARTHLVLTVRGLCSSRSESIWVPVAGRVGAG